MTKKASEEIDIDDTLNGFLIGSLLGDGCFIQRTERHNCYVRFSQCESQIDYLKWKYDFLKDRGMLRDGMVIKPLNQENRHCYPNAQMQYAFSTKSFISLNRYRKESKAELISEMNEMSVAVYILDDGSVNKKQTKISCGRLTDEERNAFVDVMKDKFNINVRIYHHPSNRSKDSFNISSAEYGKIISVIANNIPINADVVEKKFKDDCDYKVKKTIFIKYHADIDSIEQVDGSDYIDLRTAEDVLLQSGQYRRISLGVSIELPSGYEAVIIPRSSTFEKYGVMCANSIGLIDESYNGDNDVWQFPAYATRDCFIPKNTRICQFRIYCHQPVLDIQTVEVLANENRGGFGSTGEF